MLLQDKYQKLLSVLAGYGSAAVAFSGGVDSTFLLYAAKEALGSHLIAVTASAAWCPARETNEAIAFCKRLEVPHIVCSVSADEIAGFRSNPSDRCYICKYALFSRFRCVATEYHMNVVAEGSNLDDLGDYRPGLKAIAELGIRSPLREAELTKADIRALSRQFGLPTWDKPSFACLASRFVYGEPITDDRLHMVEEAEQLLIDLGFRQMRVRIHDKMARIEVLPEDFSAVLQPENREKIIQKLKALGFSYITLDLIGYRTGSMNETLPSAIPEG